MVVVVVVVVVVFVVVVVVVVVVVIAYSFTAEVSIYCRPMPSLGTSGPTVWTCIENRQTVRTTDRQADKSRLLDRCDLY